MKSKKQMTAEHADYAEKDFGIIIQKKQPAAKEHRDLKEKQDVVSEGEGKFKGRAGVVMGYTFLFCVFCLFCG